MGGFVETFFLLRGEGGGKGEIEIADGVSSGGTGDIRSCSNDNSSPNFDASKNIHEVRFFSSASLPSH